MCRVLSTGGGGEASPPNVSASPPKKKVFLRKKFKAISEKIYFDDDFKESVKVTNVQKCPILNTIFSKFSGEHGPGPSQKP